MLRILPDPLVDETALKAIRCTIRRAIRQRWFRPDQFDDLHQDIVVQLLLKFDRFDPCRASWSTFCSMVASSFLARKRKRRRPTVDSLQEGDQLEERHRSGHRFRRNRSQRERFELHEDLARILEVLPAELRQLCELYLEHQNASDIAARLGVSRNTIYRRRRMLRALIADLYLDEYL